MQSHAATVLDPLVLADTEKCLDAGTEILTADDEITVRFDRSFKVSCPTLVPRVSENYAIYGHLKKSS